MDFDHREEFATTSIANFVWLLAEMAFFRLATIVLVTGDAKINSPVSLTSALMMMITLSTAKRRNWAIALTTYKIRYFNFIGITAIFDR